MWNQRYSHPDYAYGKEPNEFLREALDRYEIKGKLLFAAEGEGRNAVYAASKGLEAWAFDLSEEGKRKALQLAREKEVRLNYEVGNLPELAIMHQTFDAIVLVFAHFPPPVLHTYHQLLAGLLKPGGYVLLEGFALSHLPYRAQNPKIGGPNRADMLFSEQMIKNDFAGLEVVELADVEVELKEGNYHNGIGRVIRFVGRKSVS